MTDDPAELGLFRIQLVEVFCAKAEASRVATGKDSGKNEPDPAIQVSYSRLSQAKTEFGVRLEVALDPAPDEPMRARLKIVVEGRFRAQDPLEQDDVRLFVDNSSLVLLWPYARGYLAQLSSMLGLQLAPLPTLDVLSIRSRQLAASPEGQ